MKYFFSLIFLSHSILSVAQREHHFDVVYAYGKTMNSISGNIVKNFKLLKSEKLHLGVGGRFGYVGGSVNTKFYTAPAKHTKSSDGIDTIIVSNPNFFNLNLSLNASYHFSSKWAIGGNIDLMGFSFGKKRSSDFYPSLASQNETPARVRLIDTSGTNVVPMKNNFHVIGDYSKGTLYSELFIRYTPIERLSIKAGYSYMITEYASTKRIGHNNNYRFRNKTGMIMIGIGYNFI